MKNKKLIIIIASAIGIVLLLLLFIFIYNKNQRNRCFDLDMTKNNFVSSLDKCYLSGVIDKEKKDYLMNKYKEETKENSQNQIDKIIKIKRVSITPQKTQHILYFESDYCNSSHDYCVGCRLNFLNNEKDIEKRNIIFFQDVSGMTFINNSDMALLNDDFCFNLDCGMDESEDFCVAKKDIK